MATTTVVEAESAKDRLGQALVILGSHQQLGIAWRATNHSNGLPDAQRPPDGLRYPAQGRCVAAPLVEHDAKCPAVPHTRGVNGLA
jgi:hypothetical protein